MGTGGRQALEGNYNCNYPDKEANNRRRFTPCRPHNGMVFVPTIHSAFFALFHHRSETSNFVKPTSFSSCQSSGLILIQCSLPPPMKTLQCVKPSMRPKPSNVCDDLHARNIELSLPDPRCAQKLGISGQLLATKSSQAAQTQRNGWLQKWLSLRECTCVLSQ